MALIDGRGGPRAPSRRLTVVVSGMIAGVPYQGGATWAVLQYLLGFRRLGHEVCFIEPLDEAALRPAGQPLETTENAAYFRRVVEDFGLGGSSALLRSATRETVGLSYAELRRVAERADVLFNISGMLTDPALLDPIPVRAYLDLDPAFIQLWHAVQGIDMRLDGHTHSVTIGQSIGRPGCRVPTCGRTWIPTPQPVVLDHWPVAERITHDALTTAANWRGYGSIEHEGVLYGQKAHSLRPLFPLPTLTDAQFVLALAIHPGDARDLEALRDNGWALVDPARVVRTPEDYQRFVRGSRAEFGLAKSGYVHSRCGWFSDRSVCYLASGRPVIAQETGFSDHLPTGEGLLAFSGMEDVLSAVEAISRDYATHARAARAVAEECFDSDRVLSRLLREVGVAP